jgi:hypothetical protein
MPGCELRNPVHRCAAPVRGHNNEIGANTALVARERRLWMAYCRWRHGRCVDALGLDTQEAGWADFQSVDHNARSVTGSGGPAVAVRRSYRTGEGR